MVQLKFNFNSTKVISAIPAVRRLGNIGNKFILLKHKYIDTAKSTVSAYQYVKKKKWFLYESLNKIRLVTTGQ